MKAILVAMFLLIPGAALAGPDDYNCSTTKNPSRVTGLYAYDERKEDYGNKRIYLRWQDTHWAHTVQIQYWYNKSKKTNKIIRDNSRYEMKKLKNGKQYKIRMRGVSNCGKGKWSEIIRKTP